MRRGVSRDLLAFRVASELRAGQVVHLGPGLPALIPRFVPPQLGIQLLSENGLVGLKGRPEAGDEDPDLVDLQGSPVGLAPGAAAVSVADISGMLRGGSVDVAVVEAHQVSRRGDLVDRLSPTAAPGGHPGVPPGVHQGPPSEASHGARRLIAMLSHTGPDGSPGIVEECSYPVAARGRVSLIFTDVAVIQVSREGLVLREMAPKFTLDDVRSITGADLVPAPDLKEMAYPGFHGRAPDKVYATGAEAVADIPDGAVVMLDGFAGPGGMANYLILALRDCGARDLTMISNTAGIARVSSFGTPPGFLAIDHSLLVDNGQIKKAVASFPVSPSPSRPSSFEQAYRRGEAELELVPQGTLAERIRAGGYGIGAFYTPTGAGTQIADGKETRVINGREYVLEYGLRADFALIRAHAADTLGNLVYKGTSRNFNAVMAPAADITIVEVDEIVEAGRLDPDAIVTPGVFVQRIVRRPPDFVPYQPMP